MWDVLCSGVLFYQSRRGNCATELSDMARDLSWLANQAKTKRLPGRLYPWISASGPIPRSPGIFTRGGSRNRRLVPRCSVVLLASIPHRIGTVRACHSDLLAITSTFLRSSYEAIRRPPPAASCCAVALQLDCSTCLVVRDCLRESSLRLAPRWSATLCLNSALAASRSSPACLIKRKFSAIAWTARKLRPAA